MNSKLKDFERNEIARKQFLTEKVILINRIEGNNKGFTWCQDYIMNFSLENEVEVGCFYDIKTEELLTDITKGTEYSHRPFLTNEDKLRISQSGDFSCYFHTHPKNWGMCFSSSDLDSMFKQLKIFIKNNINVRPYYSLGIPKINQIIIFSSRDLNNTIWKKLTNLQVKIKSSFEEKFHDYVLVLPNSIKYTKLGMINTKNNAILIKKVLKPILTINKWK